jgi:PAS domain S-box-containing protein
MNYHKLLLKQINRHLPEELLANAAVLKFLTVVNDSYVALERDTELVERAFHISEEQYIDLNKKLKHELDVKKHSVDKLKQAVGIFIGKSKEQDSDDLLMIAQYLHDEVSKRKKSEAALKTSEEKYRSIIANMNLGLLEVDNNEDIMYANAGFCQMSGFTEEELLHQKASNVLILSEETKNIINVKNNLRIKDISDSYEIFITNKNGEGRWWLVSGAPSYDDNHKLVGSIGIHLDITDHKKLEHDLIKARDEARASSQAKETFLANMSHEIRTPMSAILGMSKQLEKTKLDKDQRFFLNTIHSAADNLLVIINDILDLTKIESGKLSLENIGFEPQLIVRRVMQVMMHKAEEKGISLTNSFCDPKLPAVLIGDPYRINQVLLNLVSNAIKFTQKGAVDIECQVMEDSKKWQKIKITVSDTGIGMDKSFKERLFDKFSQEDDTVTRKYGGTGLGMSISKELIELMGGEMEVKSEKNKGSSISFTLKLDKGTKGELPDKADEEIDVGVFINRRILVTDDNEINRLLATTILQAYHVHCEEAVNGIDAIEKLQQSTYDLVLMDIQMPVMDGMEAVKIIRTHLLNNTPIVALTALALKGDNQKCLDAGFNDYLSKPFEESQLLKIVALWLPKTPLRDVDQHLLKEDVSQALFDLSQLHIIAKGNQGFVEKMKKLFVEQTPVAIKEIKSAYVEGDYQKISKIAHRIKPSIDAMGIVSLKNEILEIESSAVEYGKSDRLETLIDKLDNIIGRVVRELIV